MKFKDLIKEDYYDYLKQVEEGEIDERDKILLKKIINTSNVISLHIQLLSYEIVYKTQTAKYNKLSYDNISGHVLEKRFNHVGTVTL